MCEQMRELEKELIESEQLQKLELEFKNDEITKEEYIKRKFKIWGCKPDKEFWNEIKHKLENAEWVNSKYIK